MRLRKLEHFFADIPKDARILDLGCADGWVSRWAAQRGWHDITGLDLAPTADVVGDVRRWRELGLEEQSFDVILAFEVLEHGDFAAAVRALLRPGGRLVATTPVPRLDWVCQLFESVGVLQRRTSPHSFLVDLRTYPGFEPCSWQVKGLVSQWAVLTPTAPDREPAGRS